MNVVRSLLVAARAPRISLALSCMVVLSPVPAAAQVTRLAPAGPHVEVVDPSERISGNAAAGVVLVQDGDTIGSDRLWAYLSEPVPPELKLRISSIDGRYYAEVDYATVSQINDSLSNLCVNGSTV